MITLAQLNSDLAQAEQSAARFRVDAMSKNFEIARGSEAFLRRDEKQIEILKLAIRCLENETP